MSDAPEADPKEPATPPPLKPATVLDSIFRDDGPMPPAKFGIRLLAFAMDAALVVGITLLILKGSLLGEYPDAPELWSAYWQSAEEWQESGAWMSGTPQPKPEPELLDIFTYCMGVLSTVAWLYFALGEAFGRGRTLGKHACRLRIISTINLSQPSILTGLVRGGVKAIVLFHFIVFGWIVTLIPLLLNKRRQMGHDWLSRTAVVDERKMAEQNHS